MRGLARGLRLRDEEPISHRLVTRAIADAQRQIERRNFRRRRVVLGFDEVLDEQRRVVYGTRRRILEGEEVRERVRGFLGDAVKGLVGRHCPRGAPPGELRELFAALGALYPMGVRLEDVEGAGRAGLEALLLRDAERAYQAREAELGPDRFAELERWVLLSVLDRHWREHLDELDSLHDVLRMVASGQRDPLVEYRRRAVAMFQAMQASLKREVAAYVFDASAQASWEAWAQR
jgi:preprotein translocase subunit SecA